MDILLLGIYSAIVWFVFIKKKWLPWNLTSQVIVVTIPVIALTVMILTLNVVAPSSSDVRVFKYTVPIVAQVRGRVIEVPVEEGNRPVKKGDVLFRIDPTPYQQAVRGFEAQLANAEGNQRQLVEQLKGAKGKVSEAQGGIQAASSRVREVQAKLELARKRVEQNKELVATGAGNRFDLEKAETDLKEAEANLDAARSAEAQARSAEVQALASQTQVEQKLSARVGNDYAEVAAIRSQLDNAKWELDQTTVRAPVDGYVVNLQLRPGAFVAAMPFNAVMSLVETSGQVVALYGQNELHQIKPGNEAEFVLYTTPGKVIKAKVDSIIWAQGQGQMPPSGTMPMTGVLTAPPGRFAVKFDVAEKDKDLFMAAGAAGQAAVYTDSVAAIHILRKVFIRVSAYTNYLVLKLH
ncbi:MULTISPECIES: HlyD family secretion protein [unclassified Uliginosibacterium]|uniref:HlyD family secretion protein n=1 Tax=unclassified Uliginosibacterium TaxID=2621521 RepID=UPI000C7D3D0F|nr:MULTISPECIES: HlyD family secretion protein [unclassified Uliginosibacterium]MDO6386907.1 HlyD family secretion protein [Uliginosibacterium sp. 31-12]PLK49593.1 HlyD family secretion protein [Uliginosibacterium sp. TH139]